MQPAEVTPTIRWSNHAGFLLRSGPTGLLADPWWTGTAFDDGWSLTSPTGDVGALVRDTTHLWFSHEHPDHFHPASLRMVDPAERGRITVLYQPTRDAKVLRFCARMGFGVAELPVRSWHRLGPGLEVMLLPWDSGDSMLAMRTPTATVLNCNDAVIRDPAAMARALRPLGGAPVDVLMTQFSYANWEGNPDDAARRHAAASAKLDALVLQARRSGARWVVPFASFVWFCHEENDYLNDGVNPVGEAVRAVRERTDATPVVLYPDDEWPIGEDLDPEPAVRRYEADLRHAVEAGARTRSEEVPLAELAARADRFLARLRQDNGDLAVRLLVSAGILERARLWLTDLQVGVVLGPDGLGAEASVTADAADVALSSEALAFALDQTYGGATLHVNGRFREPPGGRPGRFRRYAQLSNMNNTGVSLWRSPPLLARRALHRAAATVGARS